MLRNNEKRTFTEIGDDPTEISKKPKMQQVILSEEGTLKYDFMFTLQKIAMAKFVSNLWMNQINQKGEIDYNNWSKIEDTIVAKVSQLFLPNYIHVQLISIIFRFSGFIVNWIDYHDDHIFCSKDSEYSAADLISNIKWTARGRIDYGQTAINILANQNICLNDDHKYKLACMYCLEDEISILAAKITVNESYLSGIAIDEHPMLYFWSAHFTGDTTSINNAYYHSDRYQHYRHMPVNKSIMLLLINDTDVTNEIPIRYMWNKLNEEDKTKHIIALVKYVDNQDFIFSLLSNIQYGLQQKVFKECSYNLLISILVDWWWWGEYFLPTALHALDIIDPMSYWKLLIYMYQNKIRDYPEGRKYMYDHFKSLFKQLWQESSMQFKEFIFHLENERNLGSFLTHNLSWKQDIDIVELILNDLSPQNKKKILSGNYGICICANLIQNDNWNLLELLLKDALTSEKDISQLKERLIQDKGSEIAIYFLKTDAYDKLKCFINWVFKSKEEVWKLFKHN